MYNVIKIISITEMLIRRNKKTNHNFFFNLCTINYSGMAEPRLFLLTKVQRVREKK